jgi:D-alanyl-D-alanine carboxypeptidase (penicillin-binding protein 5/6)
MRSRKSAKKHSRRVSLGATLVVLIVVVVYLALVLVLPLKAIYATTLPNTMNNSAKLSVDWPTSAEAAIGVLGYGSVVTNGDQTPTPTASIAKLVTALATLQKAPLSLGEQGPIITISADDVADYNNYVAEDGSVVKVVVGEQLSEYQALQAMLLPSANNMADTLATWAYGSIPNYVIAANQLVKSLDLSSTTIADASGFAPGTVSTAQSLVKLGQDSLNNPVIAQIVGQASANLPVAGIVKNVDWYVGQYDIIGIKTGNTDQAGGCFLSAAKYDLGGGNSITIIGAVMKAATLQDALVATLPMLQSVKNQISLKTVPANTAVASYKLPWGGSGDIVTKSSLTSPYLPQLPVTYQDSTDTLTPPLASGAVVGKLSLGVGSNDSSTPTVLRSSITRPGKVWRILHPQYFI